MKFSWHFHGIFSGSAMFHSLDMQASSLKLSCKFRWRLGPDWVLAIKMYGKTEILSVQISETKHNVGADAVQLKFST